MPSLRSKIIIWVIRNRHLLSFKWKPELIDESFSVEKFRNKIDKLSSRMKLPASVWTEKVQIRGVASEWIIPEKAEANKVLLYIHGGGFISGSCLTHRRHVSKFALGTGLRSLVFDYRLAPENPFPAALEDCTEVYLGLLEAGISPENIVLGGESAGGTLVLSLLLALKKKDIALPKAAFSISPVTDLSCQAESFRTNAKKDIAPMGSWDVWTRYYIGKSDFKDPLLSPQFGNYQGLPPIYICVGSYEIHLDDCLNVARKASKHGVELELKVWEGMVHAFPLLSPLFPEATQALDEICGFVIKVLKN